MNISKSNSTSILPKLVGETKHYPPAIKEWSDSVYTYNKNSLKNLPSKDIMVNKIIKGYFNLNDSKHLARSKRMRSLIRKLTWNKLFIGKPEIKQTNDNVNLTIYTLDRERQLLIRKIYHNIRKWENIRNIKGVPFKNKFNSYNNWCNKYGLDKSLKKLENNILTLSTKNNLTNTKVRKIKRKYLYLTANKLTPLSLKTKQMFYINRIHYLKTKSSIYKLKKMHMNIFTLPEKKKGIIKKKMPYFGSKLLNEAKFLRYVSQFKNKSIQARKRIYYIYIKNILSLLGINILSLDTINKNIFKEKNKKYIQYIQKFENLGLNGKVLLFFNSKENHLSKPEILFINNTQENLPYLDKVNIILSNIVKKILNNNSLVKSENFSLSKFSKTNFEKFLSIEYTQNLLLKNNSLNKVKLDISTLKKEISLVKDYINLKINYFKFGKFLPALKLLISKIYNKNIQLNIVKLKYLYLNSDIFIELLALKLSKKIKFKTAINQYLELIKVPSGFNEISSGINNIPKLNVYDTLKIKNLFTSNKVNSNDNLELILKNIYPLSLINLQKNIDSKKESKNVDTINKLTNVINIVKYKWVTGVRLELAGRLTRRYTASRSIYIYKNKGNLKNTNFSRKLDFLKKSMPVIMFRNKAKTNLQYTFTKSKRRIGAFGIKGWISGN